MILAGCIFWLGEYVGVQHFLLYRNDTLFVWSINIATNAVHSDLNVFIAINWSCVAVNDENNSVIVTSSRIAVGVQKMNLKKKSGRSGSYIKFLCFYRKTLAIIVCLVCLLYIHLRSESSCDLNFLLNSKCKLPPKTKFTLLAG